MNLPVWAQSSGGVVLGALLAYVATPIAIQAARRTAFYDLPRGYKGHAKPTPYLGGTAVMAAFALAILIGAGDLSRTLPLVCGAAVLLVLGTIDDRRTVSPQLRVVVEFAIGALFAIDGLGWKLGSGPLVDAVVMGVWVVGVVNAFNLFDNMDGQASTMAVVVAAGAAALALISGDVWVAAASAALCGACLGFLPHNLSSPARIFLGDGGSMPIGFAVAVLVANAARHAEPSSLSLLVGFLLVGIPALDTTLVVVSRTRRGISVLTGGRDHLTHRTRRRMGTPRRVAFVLGGSQAVLSTVVILGSQASSSLLVYVVLTFVVLAAAAIVALEEAISGPATAEGVALAHPQSVRAPWMRSFPDVCLAVLGLGAGLSPLFSAYYDLGVWVPMGLVLVVAAAMAMIARPPRCTRPVALAFSGLAGLGLWSLVSIAWADNAELAGVSANLWLTYAALLLLLVVLIGSGGRPRTLLIAAGAGVAIVAITVLVRLLGSDPGSLFVGGRLNSPLGYINGEGCVFAMGIWLAVALAERHRALAAGAGAALAVCMTGLALMSQSRGAAIATFVAVLLVLAVVPGFRRRVVALAFVAAGTAAAARPVVHVYTFAHGGEVPTVTAHHAVLAIVVAALVAGLAWGGVVAVVNALDRRGAPTRALLRRAAGTAAIVVIAVPVIAAAVRFSSLETTARNQWHAFVHLSAAPNRLSSQTRLFSGAGNRYDYWRVALSTFKSQPVAGVGAGNYPESYYLHRGTPEAIENPHSLELQMLSEIGVVGAALLVLLVTGIALGVRAVRRTASRSVEARTVLVASMGVSIVWFVDTSGDWMHLLPGVTAIALCGVAALCEPQEATRPLAANGNGTRLPMLLGAAGAALVLAIGGASLLRAVLVRHYLSQARAALTAHPAQAISDSQQVLRIDNANLDAYYVKAAGQARFDRAAAARSTLLQAARQAPGTFITWVLLGDLEVRAGDIAAARSYYRRALRLDPREPGLAALAAHPASSQPTAG